MKTSRARQKASGRFLFGVVLKPEFNQQAAFQISTCIPHWSVLVERKEALDYSMCCSSGRSARTSALLAILRGVHKRMQRFTLRSKRKVDVQWTRTRFALVAQVHNIGKISLLWREVLSRLRRVEP
jgi:hypothetical protein